VQDRFNWLEICDSCRQCKIMLGLCWTNHMHMAWSLAWLCSFAFYTSNIILPITRTSSRGLSQPSRRFYESKAADQFVELQVRSLQWVNSVMRAISIQDPPNLLSLRSFSFSIFAKRICGQVAELSVVVDDMEESAASLVP
jgi:hypothetical protein